MSDFGTSVLIVRLDGRSTDEADVARIKAAVETLTHCDRDRISPYSHFDLSFGRYIQCDGLEGVDINLTRYWASDIDLDCTPEGIIERDRPAAERFAEQLQTELGDAYKVESCCGEW